MDITGKQVSLVELSAVGTRILFYEEMDEFDMKVRIESQNYYPG